MNGSNPLHAALPQAAGGEASDSSAVNILVIDDDPDVRELVRLLLRTRGYVVHEAADGRIGLDMIDEVKPDLIILDLMLPGMSGMEILRHIHAKPAYQDIPMIVLSAVGDKSERTEEFWREGLHVDEFMAKGTFRNEDLLGRVAYLLKRHTYRSSQAPEEGSDQPAASPEPEAASRVPAPEPSVAPPEQIVRIFIEAWNEARFGNEFDCLGEQLTPNLTKSGFVARRRSQYEAERDKNIRHYVKEVLDVQKDEQTATVKVLRENHRGERKILRTEVYLLENTPAGWKIINIKVPNAQ